MKNEQAWIYAQLAPPADAWVNAPSPSYDAADLRDEYRRAHYSAEAIRMIEAFDQMPALEAEGEQWEVDNG